MIYLITISVTLLCIVLIVYLRKPDTDDSNDSPVSPDDTIAPCSMSCILFDNYFVHSCYDCPEYQRYANNFKNNETQLPTTEETDEA